MTKSKTNFFHNCHKIYYIVQYKFSFSSILDVRKKTKTATNTELIHHCFVFLPLKATFLSVL
jgi:hypothetical protein